MVAGVNALEIILRRLTNCGFWEAVLARFGQGGFWRSFERGSWVFEGFRRWLRGVLAGLAGGKRVIFVDPAWRGSGFWCVWRAVEVGFSWWWEGVWTGQLRRAGAVFDRF